MSPRIRGGNILLNRYRVPDRTRYLKIHNPMNNIPPLRAIGTAIIMTVFVSAHAQNFPSAVPELSTSTTTNFSLSGGKITNFTLSSMDADWRNSGNGFSAQISYDVVLKQFMGLNAAWRFAPWLQVKVGEQKTPYLYELNTSPRTLEVCGYSLGTSYLGGYTKDLCGLSTRARDWGVTAGGNLFRNGERYLLTYTLGVFNGNGFRIRDDDNIKNLTALLVLKPSGTLSITAGGLLGKYTVEDSVSGETRPGNRNRLSGGVWYDDKKVFAKSEWVWGDTDGMISTGAFVLAGWWFRQNMAIAVRGDSFRQNRNIPESRIRKTEICLTHTLGQVFRYRIQYGHTFNSLPGVKDQDALTLSISMKFSTKMIN